MANKTRQRLSEEIESLCEQAGCKESIQKLHHAQYVDRHWNPHPPRAFLSWWNQDGPKLTHAATDRQWADIDAVRAYNCEAVRQVYKPSPVSVEDYEYREPFTQE